MYARRAKSRPDRPPACAKACVVRRMNERSQYPQNEDVYVIRMFAESSEHGRGYVGRIMAPGPCACRGCRAVVGEMQAKTERMYEKVRPVAAPKNAVVGVPG